MTNIWRLFLLLVLTSTGAACTSLSGSVRPVPVMPFSFDSAVSRQVIEVRPAGGVHPFQAVLTAWDYRQDAWRKILGPWPVVVGRNGFAPRGSKREGDGRTPSGVYALCATWCWPTTAGCSSCGWPWEASWRHRCLPPAWFPCPCYWTAASP